MNIRPAGLDDARAVAEIHVRTWQAAYVGLVPEAYLASLAVERYETMWRANIERAMPQLLVAESDSDDSDAGALLGWVAFGPSRGAGAAADVAEIWAIYVGAAHWGRGVGRALWERARTTLLAQGFASIGLWAFPRNERAGRFYRSLGFAVEPDSAKQFELGGARLDEIRFARLLDQS
ncbi:MAG TPA: GNAT family N-acetyltransferase [Burkholderiaceae bacterium]|nr:GNAT family N-acetyltransferase [Burkholderiaceae bacterium]